MRPVSRYVTLLLTALSISTSSARSQHGFEDCQSILSGSYANAVVEYPNLKDQIEFVAKQQVAQWYTDRVSDVPALAKSVVLPKCDVENSNPPTVVVYGLPQKDCAHGFSTAGSNSNSDEYRVFLQQVAHAAGDRQIVYILEPDAIGLLPDGGCGNDKGYAANLGVAMDILSRNANAEMYLDVGYWTLSNSEQTAAVAKIVNAVDPNFKCKGISLNTSNYRSNAEMIATCERFVKASGRDYKCLVDTSRNYVDPKDSKEWCNSNWAGIGELPTSNTGSSVVSRYVWVKPPGESDGECTGQSDQARRGPTASIFFPDNFVQLWDNGVFVHKLGMAPINGYANATYNSITAVPATTPAATSIEQTPIPVATPSATTAKEAVTYDIDISSLDPNDATLGQVHAGDPWSDEDDYDDDDATQTATAAPTTSAPMVIEVEPPHMMVIVDVVQDDYSVDNPDTDFTRADEETNVDPVHVRKHKACA